MPQLVLLAVAGAGLYAGYRLAVRGMRHLAREAQRAAEEMERRATGAAVPKDLGTLEYDAKAGVYRPERRG